MRVRARAKKTATGPGLLDQAPRLTGGRRETVAKSALPAALKRLANELTHQYLVLYSRPASASPAQRVTVSATRPGLTARGTAVKDPDAPGR